MEKSSLKRIINYLLLHWNEIEDMDMFLFGSAIIQLCKLIDTVVFQAGQWI